MGDRGWSKGRRGAISVVMALSGWSGLALGSPSAGAKPLALLHGLVGGASLSTARVLFQQGAATLIRTPEALDHDFEDLYVVNMENHFALPEGLEALGEVLEFAPGELAVMRLAAPRVEAVAGLLHGPGSACGLLTKLDGTAMNLAGTKTPLPRIPVVQKDDTIAALVAQVETPRIKATIEQLAEIHNRFHQSQTGDTVADLLAELYGSLRGGREDVTIATFDHRSATPQRSLLVRIEGRTKPEETIILGSHLDSVNWSNAQDGRAPGADDNASGTATNLEIFRVLMKAGIRPERSIEIHAYAAEEIGLVGSQDIARSYRNAKRQVVAMVQHDMTLYKAPGTPDKIWFVTSNTDDSLNSQLGTLVDQYVGLPWAKKALFGGSSDHASWRRAGFAAAFPFEDPANHNPHIHTARDTTVQASAFDQAAGFAKLGVAFALHFGGMAL